MIDPIWMLDGTAQAALVRNGDVAPGALVEAAITRIEAIDGELGSVVIERFDAARREVADAAASGGPFTGVPMLLKDSGQELAGEPHYVGSRRCATPATAPNARPSSRRVSAKPDS